LSPDTDPIQPPAAHRCRRWPGPWAAHPPESLLHQPAPVRHRRPGCRVRRRGGAPRQAGRRCRHPWPAGRCGRRGAPGRRVHRKTVGRHPARQHRRCVQPVRSRAQAGRQARGVRQQQPRHRLLPPGRGRGPQGPGPARWPVRPVQGLRRRPLALLLRPLRHRDRVPAHRLLLSRAAQPPHARHLD